MKQRRYLSAPCFSFIRTPGKSCSFRYFRRDAACDPFSVIGLFRRNGRDRKTALRNCKDCRDTGYCVISCPVISAYTDCIVSGILAGIPCDFICHRSEILFKNSFDIRFQLRVFRPVHFRSVAGCDHRCLRRYFQRGFRCHCFIIRILRLYGDIEFSGTRDRRNGFTPCCSVIRAPGNHRSLIDGRRCGSRMFITVVDALISCCGNCQCSGRKHGQCPIMEFRLVVPLQLFAVNLNRIGSGIFSRFPAQNITDSVLFQNAFFLCFKCRICLSIDLFRIQCSHNRPARCYLENHGGLCCHVIRIFRPHVHMHLTGIPDRRHDRRVNCAVCAVCQYGPIRNIGFRTQGMEFSVIDAFISFGADCQSGSRTDCEYSRYSDNLIVPLHCFRRYGNRIAARMFPGCPGKRIGNTL